VRNLPNSGSVFRKRGTHSLWGASPDTRRRTPFGPSPSANLAGVEGEDLRYTGPSLIASVPEDRSCLLPARPLRGRLYPLRPLQKSKPQPGKHRTLRPRPKRCKQI